MTAAEVVRPTIAETAMHDAFGAAMQSACLSRQVGAALLDQTGNVIATGTNEVPRAGGGVYGESFQHETEDHRCVYQKMGKFCSNTREQNKIIDELIADVPELESLDGILASDSGFWPANQQPADGLQSMDLSDWHRGKAVRRGFASER